MYALEKDCDLRAIFGKSLWFLNLPFGKGLPVLGHIFTPGDDTPKIQLGDQVPYSVPTLAPVSHQADLLKDKRCPGS
jgi:hypothetical protein